MLKDETLITCSVCGITFEEEEVNITDYDLDLCVTCEKNGTMHLETIHTSFGSYQCFSGRVWITLQDRTIDTQGTNIAVMNQETGELRVIAYVVRKGHLWSFSNNRYDSIRDIVLAALHSLGWTDAYIAELLGSNSDLSM